MAQAVIKRRPQIDQEVVEKDMHGTSTSSKSFIKSSKSFNWCTSIFDCCLCRGIIGFLFWSKRILMKIPCCRGFYRWCRGLFRYAKNWEECKSLWDKAAVFCVPFVFMMCGTVFFVLTCEGPCEIISNKFQYFQKNTLHEDHDRLVRENENLKTEIGGLRSIANEEKTEKEKALTRLVRENENLKTEIGGLRSIYQEEIERLKHDNEYLEKRVNEEKTEKEKALTSLWDIAAVFCVPFVFMMCGTVFFVLTCEGPCAIISKRFQYFQKNTLYEDHDRLVREDRNRPFALNDQDAVMSKAKSRFLTNNQVQIDMPRIIPPTKSSIKFNKFMRMVLHCCKNNQWITAFFRWSKEFLKIICCCSLFKYAIEIVCRRFRSEEYKKNRYEECEKGIIELKYRDEYYRLIEREGKLCEAYNQEKQEKENVLKREKTLLQAYNDEKQKKEDALARLSALGGDRLRLNNPGIADLSDEYRPNKLAEKFSELYDNEWTEFYESTFERTGRSEEQIIGQLLKLIQEIYTVCQQQAENQRHALINFISDPSNAKSENGSPPDGILIKIIDFQKKTVPWAIEAVKKKIMKKYEDLSNNKGESKRKYIDRCVQLCWMMSIQDPPMHLDFGPEKDSVINKNVYKLFTKTGDTLDFMVWPAVFLHHNGPLVQKGVLQPK
uniref:Uncharacterized protein LOC111123104 isoform X1 n=2 Tax=Crassostrea virginica TaxID=6565 RepID=A0A8B8CYF7_CRAVI|nr:uncharacterized protein LOC111123104 isoform X1 [Crassostrea virginica]XP_022320919.1 uncharacterized protein LOC111123104 isoform X1 [Crassostrea virginica]